MFSLIFEFSRACMCVYREKMSGDIYAGSDYRLRQPVPRRQVSGTGVHNAAPVIKLEAGLPLVGVVMPEEAPIKLEAGIQVGEASISREQPGTPADAPRASSATRIVAATFCLVFIPM
jgi:hypothetical protein